MSRKNSTIIILKETLRSITSKYVMSDIETGPEIFETSDVESMEELVPPPPKSEEIADDTLDPQSAREKFEENVIVDTFEIADFLGSLQSSQNGYSVRKLGETPSQRLLRIASELEEIKQESDSREIDRLKNDLDRLIEYGKHAGFHQELFEEAFQSLKSEDSFSNKLESTDIDDKYKTATQSAATFLELENRLNSLEQKIGPSDLRLEKSLRNHVNDLARKIDVIYDPEHDMSQMKSELKKLNKEIETLATNRRLALLSLDGKVDTFATQPFDVKIDSIYNNLPEMQKMAQVLPLLITRLRSLHNVHAEVAHSVGFISQIDKTMSDMKMDMQKWNESLDSVTAGIKEHQETFENNRKVAESRLADLEKRVAKLGE